MQGNLLVGEIVVRRRPEARRRPASSSAAQKEEARRRTASVARARTGRGPGAVSRAPESAPEMPLWDMQQSAAQKEETWERTIYLLSCI